MLGDFMKKMHWSKELLVTGLFLLLLFGMLLGLTVPVALRRIGIGQEAVKSESAAGMEQPDEKEEPVNFRERYPFEETAAAEENAGFYKKLKMTEAGLKGIISQVETACNEAVPGRTAFIESYIGLQKALGSRIIHGDDVVVKMDNGLLTFLSEALTEEEADTCASNLTEFAGFVQKQGADFLYVQTPNKINKYDSRLPKGVDDYANANADGLVEALHGKGLPVLDLRDSIVKDMEFDEAFYASDHHWKPETGLWAAEQILLELNARFGTGFDTDACKRTQYEEQVYPGIFLGALGKKTGRGYVPMDDMSILTPVFDTDFTMKIVGSGYTYNGSFRKAFIDESQLEPGDPYTKNPYAAYFRDDQALVEVTNHRRSQENLPKVLLLKDSFGLTAAPFLAGAMGELDVIDLRYFNGSLEKYMEETKPDLVVVMYNPKAVTAPAGYHADLFDFR